MLRSATFVCTLLLVGGIRIVRRRQQEESTSTNDDAVTAELSSGSLRTRVNDTLKDLDDHWQDAKTAGVDLLKEIAEIDWHGDIGQQMKNIVIKTGKSIAQYIVTSIDPLLGVVFSLMSSLFGWGGGGESSMAEQILNQVDKMIKDAVNSLKREFVQLEIEAVMEIINNAGTDVSRWDRIPDSMTRSFVNVFKQCWNRPTSTDCRDWRTKASGGAHLMLELKFTELMVMAGSTMLRHDLSFEVFAENIELAANRTLEHYKVFEAFRKHYGDANYGVTRGSVNCNGLGYCGTNPIVDKLAGKEICGRPRRTCRPRAGCRTKQQNALHLCRERYLTSIRHDLEKIKSEVEALQKAAMRLRGGERARHRARGTVGWSKGR